MNLNSTEFVIAVIVIPWGESRLIVASLRKNASKEGNKMAEQIRAEEGAIEKGALRSTMRARVSRTESKISKRRWRSWALSGVVTRPCRSTR